MKDESNQRPQRQHGARVVSTTRAVPTILAPRPARPGKIGLYDPAFEHDACGVGFIAHVKGERSHQILVDASTMLCHVDHRGARGSEVNTGDGAGILTALPHRFLERIAREELHASLPDPGRFAAGLVFLPTRDDERAYAKSSVEQLLAEQGQRVVGWREVPVDPDACDLGPTARAAQPRIELLIVAAAPGLEGDAFERQIYLARKRASHLLRGHSTLEQAKMFYISSLSTKVIIYKGMLTASQLFPFFPDLSEPDYESHLAMIHSRFSTNTFPSWDRAQPNRFMAHNGEINTLRGNMNWMHARQGVVRSDLFGAELEKAFPIVEPDCSDSGTFDNVLEFLLMTGRTLQRSIMMMIPEAWQNDPQMTPEKRAFYEYHSCLLEPWDGPASIAFTDGRYIGAVLDRNGLRPSRYYVTTDDLVIMASEVGVLPIAPERVVHKGRLQPGRMFLVDFEQGRIIDDAELKAEFCGKRPYGQWLAEQKIELDELPRHPAPAAYEDLALLQRLQAHGYTVETVGFMLRAIVEEQRDPVGSMGNDAALAILSDQPRMLYDYFQQLFAQVTNPAIDSIREEVVMSLECYIGPERNPLQTTPEHANRLRVPHPILTDEELAAIKHLDYRGWKSRTIDITWPVASGEAGMEPAIARICAEAEQAIDDGYQVAVLSDRAVGPDRLAISALLAVGAVHHHLIRRIKRTQIALVLETAEAREVHHHCLLVGYGADAINPYLAFASLCRERRLGRLSAENPDDATVIAHYRKGVAKGMLKVMGKMGISTLQSYKGAQIFEAVGLRDEVIESCFAGTASRIQGAGFATLAKEAIRRHELGYPPVGQVHKYALPNPGLIHWRANGEEHMWTPATIAAIQEAARTNSRGAYEQFAKLVHEHATRSCALRGLLKFKDRSTEAMPLDQVESAADIVKRFCTGAMSFGSISAETHETLAIAMNRIGGKSNTGEGGEDPKRFVPLPNGDSRRSAIKQVASGRFGVTSWYLTNADELQIKISQGAKPGEGGELPGHKVDAIIAKTRYSTPGVGLISPPPHHDIYSIEDIKQLIHDLKNANPEARVSVKLVSEVGVGTVA
ncbi:MAG TPA: glutamate synthase large subunit, partial [Thermoanaerobaculia bacterium]|nr:glutamate synthase large subunit [Thermoanaerobaculia bacterium]